MGIQKVRVQNFTVFEELELQVGEGINVIIGTNGTGKTHLLKSLYGICESINNRDREDVYDISQPYFSVNSIELVRDRTDRGKRTEVTAYFSKENYASYVIVKHEGMKVAADGASYMIDFNVKGLFIPAKEMLSHSKGFLALNNKFNIPFDKTYVDILTNAELPEARVVSELDQKLLDTISKVIEGTVIHENGKFYMLKKSGMKIEFPIEAEGLRKFGLLWKLIRNGLLEKGTILFWDEPEANINPELMPILVEVLLEVQRNGVQIFIATHSYNLAKYFEVKRGNQDQVLYHHLYKTEHGVKVESDPYFGNLKNNPIIEADSKLLDDVIKGTFEE